MRHQTYADDTTLRSQGAARPNQPEAGERRPERKEKEKWTYVQRIRTGAEGTGTELKVMFDDNTPHTLILHAAAARAALAPKGREKWVMSPDSGEMDESSCGYSVPLVDCQGNVHLLKGEGSGLHNLSQGEEGAAYGCHGVRGDGGGSVKSSPGGRDG